MTLPSPGSPVAIVAIFAKGPCLFPLFKSCGLLGGPLLVGLRAQRVERRADRAG